MRDLAGSLVLDDRYALGARIGAGGVASVYEAVDRRLGKRVAVKVLSPAFWGDEVQLRRFSQEARSIARVRGEHLVDVTDFGVSGEGIPYLVMELLEGRDLHDALREQGGAMPWPRAIGLAAQVCEALAAAHAAGLVHRDVKPSNIFLVERRGREVVKLLDLGIAKATHEDDGAAPLTNPALGVPGTVQYMAPEQARGEPVTPATDLYALGVVLFRTLTGRLPFVAPDDAVYTLLRMHCEDPPPLPSSLAPGLPPAVDAVVLRCLAKEPGSRWPSAEALAAVLAAILAGPRAAPAEATAPSIAPQATAPSTEPDHPRWARTSRTTAWRGVAALGLGLALLAGVLAIALRGEPAPRPSPALLARAEPPGDDATPASPRERGLAVLAAAPPRPSPAALSPPSPALSPPPPALSPPSAPELRRRPPRVAPPPPPPPDPSLMRELGVLKFRLRRCPAGEHGAWPDLRVDLQVDDKAGRITEVTPLNLPTDHPYVACVRETLLAEPLHGVAGGLFTAVPIEL